MAIVSLNTIKNWFKTGLKPNQAQFWDTWDSFRHKSDKVPVADVEGIDALLLSKTDRAVYDNHTIDADAHELLFEAKEDKAKKGVAGGYVPLNEFSKIAFEFLSIVNNLTTGGTTSLLSAEQGVVLQAQIDGINTLLTSNDINLDTVQEIVDAIKTVETSLSSILVNDLTTGGTTKALTAEMGKTLKGLVDAKETSSNKATIILEGTNESSDKLYPTIKAVYDWCVVRFQQLLLNIETTTDIMYTLDYTNSAKRTVFTSANPVTVTIPTNSVSSIPIGARMELTAQGDGEVTIGGAGITFTTNLSLSMVKGETRILTKIATDTWTVEGNNKEAILITRFSKNINPNASTNIFFGEFDAGQEVFADMNAQTGKLYPIGLNSYTNMQDGDIIESYFIIQKQQGPSTANYVLGFDIYTSSSLGVEPTLTKNFDYSWDTNSKSTLNIKVIFTKIAMSAGAWNLVSFVILIDGVFVYNSNNFFTYSAADIRMKMTNYDAGIENILITQLQSMNLFIPSSDSLI